MPNGVYDTADGQLNVTMVRPTDWPPFCEVIERSDLLEDSRFSTHAARGKSLDELYAVVRPVFKAKSTEWLARRFTERNIMNYKVNSYEEFLREEQVAATPSPGAAPSHSSEGRWSPDRSEASQHRLACLAHATTQPYLPVHRQTLLYADGDKSLLVVLQALDAAGKDGVIRHVFSGMNPQGTFVFGFKQPSNYEAAHDFLWRAHLRTPGKGEVVIFNRSYYEDVLVVRVHKLVGRSVWSKRYDLINSFEAMLALSGTTILKFFLHISPDEQLSRFKQRLDDPARQWKISE